MASAATARRLASCTAAQLERPSHARPHSHPPPQLEAILNPESAFPGPYWQLAPSRKGGV
eukprot:354160-Chlamydomonas_euryale.AAC.2